MYVIDVFNFWSSWNIDWYKFFNVQIEVLYLYLVKLTNQKEFVHCYMMLYEVIIWRYMYNYVCWQTRWTSNDALTKKWCFWDLTSFDNWRGARELRWFLTRELRGCHGLPAWVQGKASGNLWDLSEHRDLSASTEGSKGSGLWIRKPPCQSELIWGEWRGHGNQESRNRKALGKLQNYGKLSQGRLESFADEFYYFVRTLLA